MSRFDVCVIGGCGRVGLPLSIALADRGMTVVVHDLDQERLKTVRSGVMPFKEEGCAEKLTQVINRGLWVSEDLDCVSASHYVVVTIGTPFDRGSKPDFSAMLDLFSSLSPHLVSKQCIILRSTVYPGTTEKIRDFLAERRIDVRLAFCPERIVEGKALAELESLPQIIGAFDDETAREASALFKTLTPDLVVVTPREAELAKLFANAWRYIKFSVANEFFMVADQHGLDYSRIHHAMAYKYPRARNLPKPGLTSGPCLFKDTMQLAAYSNGRLSLGEAAASINEGLPEYIVQRLKARTKLSSSTVGILGMAFKADSDDERSSLSVRLKTLLSVEAKKVCCSDPFVVNDHYVSAEELVRTCDVIILATPHKEYHELQIGKDRILVDVWNFYGRGFIS